MKYNKSKWALIKLMEKNYVYYETDDRVHMY